MIAGHSPLLALVLAPPALLVLTPLPVLIRVRFAKRASSPAAELVVVYRVPLARSLPLDLHHAPRVAAAPILLVEPLAVRPAMPVILLADWHLLVEPVPLVPILVPVPPPVLHVPRDTTPRPERPTAWLVPPAVTQRPLLLLALRVLLAHSLLPALRRALRVSLAPMQALVQDSVKPVLPGATLLLLLPPVRHALLAPFHLPVPRHVPPVLQVALRPQVRGPVRHALLVATQLPALARALPALLVPFPRSALPPVQRVRLEVSPQSVLESVLYVPPVPTPLQALPRALPVLPVQCLSLVLPRVQHPVPLVI